MNPAAKPSPVSANVCQCAEKVFTSSNNPSNCKTLCLQQGEETRKRCSFGGEVPFAQRDIADGQEAASYSCTQHKLSHTLLQGIKKSTHTVATQLNSTEQHHNWQKHSQITVR